MTDIEKARSEKIDTMFKAILPEAGVKTETGEARPKMVNEFVLQHNDEEQKKSEPEKPRPSMIAPFSSTPQVARPVQGVPEALKQAKPIPPFGPGPAIAVPVPTDDGEVKDKTVADTAVVTAQKPPVNAEAVKADDPPAVAAALPEAAKVIAAEDVDAETVMMVFPADVLFTPDGYEEPKIQFRKGVQQVPVKYADHWYLGQCGATKYSK